MKFHSLTFTQEKKYHQKFSQEKILTRDNTILWKKKNLNWHSRTLASIPVTGIEIVLRVPNPKLSLLRLTCTLFIPAKEVELPHYNRDRSWLKNGQSERHSNRTCLSWLSVLFFKHKTPIPSFIPYLFWQA